ncbi:MAG: nuclear transport factor 2 family protein [Flavobacteriales bacterium]|nr:nuclear transport factor 2 family protein [Flavobacteriales bacterium]
MWKYSAVVLLLLLMVRCNPPAEQDVLEIRRVMEDQVSAWNRGDVEAFMQGYWQSDKLTFTGGKTKTVGWQDALDRYNRSYPTPEKMGQLEFNDLNVELTGGGSAFATGEWKLLRKSDTLSGRFTLVWRKLAGNWVIIADHSS